MNPNYRSYIHTLHPNINNSLYASISESLLNELTYPREIPNNNRTNSSNIPVSKSPHGIFEKNDIWGPPNELPKQITNWKINTAAPSKKTILNPNAPEFIFPS